MVGLGVGACHEESKERGASQTRQEVTISQWLAYCSESYVLHSFQHTMPAASRRRQCRDGIPCNTK